MTENPVAIVRDVLCDWLEEVKVGDLPSEQEAAHLFGMLGTAGYSIVPNALATARPTAPAATAEAWVSVLERLPTDWFGSLCAPMVLIARTPAPYTDPIAVGYLYDGEWFVGIPGSDENMPVNNVTHWQPLPTPPTA